jgi:hypothetical protein
MSSRPSPTDTPTISEQRGIAVLTDAPTTSTLEGESWAVHGVALSEDAITHGGSGQRRYWPADALRPAADGLANRPIVKNFHGRTGQATADEVIGVITDTGYQPGVGIVFEGEISDKEIANKIANGYLDVSVVAGIGSEYYDADREVHVVESIAGFRDIAVVADGADRDNAITIGENPAIAALSRAALAGAWEPLQLSEARAPSYDGTRANDSWPAGGPGLGDYIEGYYDGDPPEDAPSNWGDLPQAARDWISAKTLIGDSNASGSDGGISFPVVYPDGDLSEDGLQSARRMAGHAERAGESIRSITQTLLENEFDHEFDTESNASVRPPLSTTLRSRSMTTPMSRSAATLQDDSTDGGDGNDGTGGGETRLDAWAGVLAGLSDLIIASESDSAPNNSAFEFSALHRLLAAEIDGAAVSDVAGVLSPDRFAEGFGPADAADWLSELVASADGDSSRSEDDDADGSEDDERSDGDDTETNANAASMTVSPAGTTDTAMTTTTTTTTPTARLQDDSDSESESDDPGDHPMATPGDAVRWPSSAGGRRESADWRYGIVVDGLADRAEDDVLVAVYEPSPDGDAWTPRDEQNVMNRNRLIPIGDGVGALPPISTLQRQAHAHAAAPPPASQPESRSESASGLTAALQREFNLAGTTPDRCQTIKSGATTYSTTTSPVARDILGITDEDEPETIVLQDSPIARDVLNLGDPSEADEDDDASDTVDIREGAETVDLATNPVARDVLHLGNPTETDPQTKAEAEAQADAAAKRDVRTDAETIDLTEDSAARGVLGLSDPREADPQTKPETDAAATAAEERDVRTGSDPVDLAEDSLARSVLGLGEPAAVDPQTKPEADAEAAARTERNIRTDAEPVDLTEDAAARSVLGLGDPTDIDFETKPESDAADAAAAERDVRANAETIDLTEDAAARSVLGLADPADADFETKSELDAADAAAAERDVRANAETIDLTEDAAARSVLGLADPADGEFETKPDVDAAATVAAEQDVRANAETIDLTEDAAARSVLGLGDPADADFETKAEQDAAAAADAETDVRATA